nr:hypothetical protein [Thermoanaerobacterales bacterium]
MQIVRLRRGTGSVAASDGAGAAGVAVALVAVALDPEVAGGAVAVAAIAALQAVWVRRPPVPAKVLGFRQLALGLAVVAATAVGTWIA